MSTRLATTRPLPRPPVDWVTPLLNIVLVVGVAVLIGVQYIAPDKRVLQVLLATILFGIAWRVDIVAGLAVMVLALPFPRGTVFGTTNLALMLLLAVIWLLRINLRQLDPPRATPLDKPIVGLVIAYIISFYNIPSTRDLYFALQNTYFFIGTLVMFYLVVNNTRSSKELELLHVIQTVSILSVCLVAVWELNNPGKELVPGWIGFGSEHGMDFNLHDLRVGSIFRDYELLAEWAGLNILFLSFLFLRAKSQARRVWFGFVLAMCAFVMFATITRGPIVSLSVGVLYLLWLCRRRLRVVPVVVGLAISIAALCLMEYYVANFTRSGSVFKRLEATTFQGIVPDTRIGIWTDAWQRMLEHPFIGHGPYYSAERGLHLWFWPHNVYLYVGNLTGFVGLGFFLWLLWKLWRITKPDVGDLNHPDYARAYRIIAHAQLAMFIVDEWKIEYLRNSNYQFQVWLMWGYWVVAYKLVARAPARRSRAEVAVARPAAPESAA